MITKEEKKRIVALAEKGVSNGNIAEALVIGRGLLLYVRLISEVTTYLEGLVIEVKGEGNIEECAEIE